MYTKNQVSMQFNGGVLAITFPNGDFYSLSSDDPRYRKAIAAFNKGDYSAATFTNIMDMRKELTAWGAGKVMVTNSGNVVVVQNGVEHEVNERLGSVLKEYVQNGLPVDAFVNFVIRLMKNPSMRSRDLFYDFMRLYGMSFTQSGMCRAYKAVTNDYKDKHTNKVDNRIGVTVPRFTRAQVDDNPDNACSFG